MEGGTLFLHAVIYPGIRKPDYLVGRLRTAEALRAPIANSRSLSYT